MDLRHFRYFRAVYEERHMYARGGAAGDRSSRRSVSRSARLSRNSACSSFGAPRREWIPTAPADILYDRTSSFLFQIEEAVEAVRSISRGEQGRLAIGVSSSAAFSPIIPRLIRSFRSALPDVTISLGEDAAEELIQELRLNTKGVVFTRSVPESLAEISVVTLVEEPMFAALPSNHAPRQQRDRHRPGRFAG